MKLNRIFSSDFETNNHEDDCRVWAWASCDINNTDNIYYGNDLESFMRFIKKGNQTHYFHNLKFDIQFILYYLFHHGFTYSEEYKDDIFKTLISNNGLFYSLDITYHVFDDGNRWHTKFYDSLKKLPMSVSSIAKAFNLEEQKEVIDYNLVREKGHELTKEEKSYIKNDVVIIAKALKIQHENNLKKMTIGSDALSDFKKIISTKKYEYLFPSLSKELYEDLKPSYKGGFTYVNKIHKKKYRKNILVYDVNSLYPSVMRYEKLPYDTPRFFEGKYEFDENYPLYIQKIFVNFKIKKNHIPTIQLKHNFLFSQTEYLETSKNEVVTLHLTNIELPLFLEHYEILSIEYVCGYKFKAKTGFFDKYIDKWTNIKIESKKQGNFALYTIAKLMLNSLYGKFGSSIITTQKIPYLSEDDIVCYKKGEETEKDSLYLPMAIFITSYARYKTISSAQKVYKNFCYADTDSIHLTNISKEEVEKLIEVDDYKLGAWKLESEADIGYFIRAKTYIEKSKNELNIKCAGMPDNLKQYVTLENFNEGLKLEGKLLPKRVKGGVVLEATEFTMK